MTKKHQDRNHAELPPSSADYWMNCYGWRAAVAQHVELYGVKESGPAAKEGTVAHEKFEAHLLVSAAHMLAPDFVSDATPRELDPVEDDEFDDLMPMIEWVENQTGVLYLETQVDCGAPFGFVDQTGTVDVTLVDPTCLTIADLKFGRNVVEVMDAHGRLNRQLMSYLTGAIHRHGRRPKYRIVILQPRAWHYDGPIREIFVTQAQVDVFMFELEEAMDGNFNNGECSPGAHCRPYCAALGSCRAHAAKALDIFAKNPLVDR